jgi:hypothetical protein
MNKFNDREQWAAHEESEKTSEVGNDWKYLINNEIFFLKIIKSYDW